LIKEIVMRFKKAILGVAIGSAAVTAWAFGPESGAGMFGMGGEGRGGHHFQGHGHGDGHGHGRGGPGGGRFGEQSPEQAQARAERMAERLVRSVDGTPEQKEKISAIAKAAATDLAELRKQGGDLRRQGMDLLKAPTIDRAAIEALRTKQMGVADALSKRMATALAETAEVLSPEQRAKLAERMQSHRPRRG
jgi:Spy/CpxP family protein refolding chaperone